MEQRPPPEEVPPHNHIGKLNPLEQSIVDYTGYTAPQPEPPRTFVIECNKSLAQADGNALQTNEWTNVFPSIKLKKGDIISVNSSFLSARGGGDLIQFDSTNNTTRIIFEYYQTNDNTNGKRPSYNIKGNTPVPQDWNQYGGYYGTDSIGMNCLPVDYRPMRVYRLMKTFTSIDPTHLATPLGTDFSLYPFSDANTQFPSAVREPFWGYKVAPKALQDNIEDTYVPGLLRHPTINYHSPNYITAVPTTNGNLSQRFPYATIWYISTNKSHLGACSDGATMRIYFLGSTETANYTYQGLNVPMSQILADNLNLVKSLRVGQYIKFMNPNCFGEDAYNPWNNEQSYTANYGSNVYICDSYVADGGGFSPVADRFIQAGSGAHPKNPMGNLMKITSTYFGVSPAYPQGNNSVAQTYMSDINMCPYIEVACSEGFSCCWGNPNAYVSSAGGGRASFNPFQNGPMTIPATLNTNDPPPLPLSICPFGQIQIRVMEMKNTTPWATTTSADGSSAYSAGFFPDSLSPSKKLYMAYHPKYLDKDNTAGTGFAWRNETGLQTKIREDLLSTIEHNKNTFLDAVGSSVACKQTIIPTNYNMLGLNSDLTYTQSDPTKPLYYGDQYSRTFDGYAGGRLPTGYMPDNEESAYSDGSNYMTALKELSSSFASMYEYNKTDLFNFTTDPFDETARASMINTTNSKRIPIRNGTAQAVDTLFMTSQTGETMKIYVGCSINNTANGIGTSALTASPATGSAIAGSGANFESGMENFINNFGGFPYSPSESADPNNGGRMYYGNLGLASDSYVSPVYDNIGDRTFIDPLGGIVHMDLRIPFAQMEQNLIVRATNPETNVSEWMLVKTYPYSVKNNSASANPAFFTNTQPVGTSTSYSIHSTGYNGAHSYQHFQNVRMVIVKRDLLGTGKQNFTGLFETSNSSNFTGNIIKPTENTAYMEFFNSLAHFENRIKLDGISRDLTALNALSKSDNTLYNELWAGADTTGAIGGDFVLCDDPKMPYVDTTNITHMTDNTIWLLDEFVKQGEPTEQDSGEIDPNGNPVMIGHTNGLTWNIHYDYIDLKLDSEATYFGVGDIGAEITKQLQAPTDLYKTNKSGGSSSTDLYWENTAGRFPINKMFRPIHGPMSSSNTEDAQTGMLNGAYHEGDFCFFSAMSDAFFKQYKCLNPSGGDYVGGVSAGTGLFPVFPRSQNTFINIAPTTNAFSLNKWCLSHKSPQPRTLYSQISYGDKTNKEDWYSYDNTTFSQFIGTTSPTFSYNENFNRFEWTYFHQPLYTPYDAVAQTGGNPSAYIWSNVSEGLEIYDRFGGINVVNWSAPQLKFAEYASRNSTGFLNVLTEDDAVGGAFMTKLGFNKDWRTANSGHTHYAEDMESSIKLSTYKPLGTTRSDYSVAQGTLYTAPSLWNAKANSSKNTPFNNVPEPPTGSAEDQANRQALNDKWGTTDYTDATFFGNKSDWYGKVGDTLLNSRITGPITAGATNANMPIADPIPVTTPLTGRIFGMGNTITYTGISFPSTFTGCNGFQYGMDTGDKIRLGEIVSPEPDITKLAPSGALIAYGWGSTQGTPGSFSQGVATIGASPTFTYSNTNTFKDINLDDIKLPYTAYDVGSNSLRAPQLPKKTEIGYFFIMSDLIDKHEFYGSKNEGAPINCIGILSKNYENHDFYYSFQSPVEFYLKADKTITSITTRILTPNMEMPIGLDYNSSIIYTIIRPDPVPDADVPPIALQQQFDYEEMEKLQEQAGLGAGGRMIGGSQHVATGVGTGLSGGGGNNLLNYYRNAIVQSVINPSPNQASALGQLEMGISTTLSGMSAPNRLRANAEGFAIDPTAVQPTDPDPEDDPVSIPTTMVPPEIEAEVGILAHVNKILEQLGPDAEPELVGNALETASKKNPYDDDDDRPPPTPPPAYAELPPGYEPIVEALGERIEQIAAGARDTPTQAGGKPDTAGTGLTFEEAFRSLDPSWKQTRELTALYRAGFDPNNPRSYPSAIARRTIGQLAPLLEQRGTPLSGELISGLQEELGRREAGQASPKAGENPYYLPRDRFGGTSLREAITRTIAPEFGYGDPRYNDKRTDSDLHSNWFHTDPRVPDHPTLKKNSQQYPHIGDENPFDIRTWSVGRLQAYERDPLFHLKEVSKQGKVEEKLGSYPQKDRLSRAGYDAISNEIKRRTSTYTDKKTGEKKSKITEIAVQYGSASKKTDGKGKNPVGGSKRIANKEDEYLKKSEAPKNYQGRIRAHASARGIDKPKLRIVDKPRPAPIQYSQQPA